jgi:hypothetical protein
MTVFSPGLMSKLMLGRISRAPYFTRKSRTEIAAPPSERLS